VPINKFSVITNHKNPATFTTLLLSNHNAVVYHEGVHNGWKDIQTYSAYCHCWAQYPKGSPTKEAPSDRVSFLTASCVILSCSLWKTTAPTSRTEGGSVQLAAWLPGNTDCDGLQCAGCQISTEMQGLLWTVSAILMVLQFSHLQFFKSIQFLATEWLNYLPLPLQVNQLFLPHHI